MINIRVVEPAVHESGKVVQLFRAQHGGGQHGLVGDPLFRTHLRKNSRQQNECFLCLPNCFRPMVALEEAWEDKKRDRGSGSQHYVHADTAFTEGGAGIYTLVPPSACEVQILPASFCSACLLNIKSNSPLSFVPRTKKDTKMKLLLSQSHFECPVSTARSTFRIRFLR